VGQPGLELPAGGGTSGWARGNAAPSASRSGRKWPVVSASPQAKPSRGTQVVATRFPSNGGCGRPWEVAGVFLWQPGHSGSLPGADGLLQHVALSAGEGPLLQRSKPRRPQQRKPDAGRPWAVAGRATVSIRAGSLCRVAVQWVLLQISPRDREHRPRSVGERLGPDRPFRQGGRARQSSSSARGSAAGGCP